MITVEHFQKIFPHCKITSGLIEAFTTLLPQYQIDNQNRIAGFISQCGVESAGWTCLEENLNYSAEGLIRTFGSHFNHDLSIAEQYAHKPEAIANRIYANRMGNGDEASGDGYKYRGRGPIQLTGKSEYEQFAKAMYADDAATILDNPDYLHTDINTALMSAIWFWHSRNLNKYADVQDIKMLTEHVNGGFLGLAQREEYFKEIVEYC